MQSIYAATDALAAFGEAAVDLLADELSNPDEDARFYTVRALAPIGGRKWRNAVSVPLKSETSQRVREAAQEAVHGANNTRSDVGT